VGQAGGVQSDPGRLSPDRGDVEHHDIISSIHVALSMLDQTQVDQLSGTLERSGFRITVIVPTRVGWPDMRTSVDAILPQLDAANAELIVADSSERPVPDFAAAENITWLVVPDAPSHALRAAGYAAATAAIVAITEDHCAPEPDWLEHILAEHEREPNAAGVFGLVDNGSRDHAVDWALFSVGYLAWAPPHPARRGAPGHANLSFKRWIFDAMPVVGDQVLEFRYVAALRDAGYEVVGTDRTRVTHFQSAGLPATATLLFHNGRTIAGLRRQQMSAMDWLRILAPGPLALFRTWRIIRLAAEKPQMQRNIQRSLPFVALLNLAHTIGESVGYLGGAGQSGRRLH
jgi:hypothetical protein